MSSEEPDIMVVRVYVHPSADANYIKTVCATGTKAPDPSAIGSKGDADTVTCKVLNGFQGHKVLLKYDGDSRH